MPSMRPVAIVAPIVAWSICEGYVTCCGRCDVRWWGVLHKMNGDDFLLKIMFPLKGGILMIVLYLGL